MPDKPGIKCHMTRKNPQSGNGCPKIGIFLRKNNPAGAKRDCINPSLGKKRRFYFFCQLKPLNLPDLACHMAGGHKKPLIFIHLDMEVKNAVAGTLESGDIMIQIAPAETKGLHIDLESSVAAQFGRQIREVITETLTGLGVEDASVKAVDKGARDCTIRARVTAAAVRATGVDVWA